jgi:hypothetical protein
VTTTASLPRLPPAFRVGDADLRPGGSSLLDLLAEDHDRLLQLGDRLAAAGDDTGTSLEDVLVATVSRHIAAEEQYLLPTVSVALPGGDEAAGKERETGRALLRATRALHDTARTDPRYAERVASVRAQLSEHLTRQSAAILPGLARICPVGELIRLGNRLRIAVEAAPTRPHPGAPSAPPLNKVAAPALGVLDKVRDVLIRRVTWPEDLIA